MKKAFLLFPAVLILIAAVWWLYPRPSVQPPAPAGQYLEAVLANLGQIKTATYISTHSVYSPFDTVALYTNDYYHKAYVNPADTFVGVSYVEFPIEDTTRMKSSYDGQMRALVYEEDKTLVIDSFRFSHGPFRLVNTPFFTRAKKIIEYALETRDSLTIDINDFGDSVQYRFSIYDTVPEIIGNRIVYFPSMYGSHQGEVARYEFWVNKADNLPFRIVRDMPHNKDIETCRDVQLNKGTISDFAAAAYFPAGFTIRPYGMREKASDNGLVGKAAPDWMLEDADQNQVGLQDMTSKVLLLHFTGVGCGPCQASVPFLKQLTVDYASKDFQLVGIETWSSSLRALKGYQEKNALNYPYLLSSKDVTEQYQIQSVPVFVLLDQHRVIRKVISGYGKTVTDKEITSAINEML